MTETVNKLISEIESEPLSQEEEKKLINIYQNKLDGWFEAKTKVIHSCLLYVVKCANEYSIRQDKVEDLISEGSIGLMEALDKFDQSRDIRFLTFASYSIKGRMLKYLAKIYFNTLHVPQDVVRLAIKVKNYIQEYEFQHLCAPEKQELKDHFNIDDFNLGCILTLIESKSLSLDYKNDCGAELYAELKDDAIISPDAAADSSEVSKIVENIIAQLPKKHRFVINNRYGFNNVERKDLASIGEYLSLSKQRVAQIEFEAIKMIKREIKKKQITIECLQ
jgi:RNA polymerase sigma factor (sigma-70 family)